MMNPAKVSSKKEAASSIAAGARHVVSVTFQTEAVETGTIPTFSWEAKEPTVFKIRESAKRMEVMEQLVAGLKGRRDLKERVHSSLEEMLTNAIYHSYRSGEKAKYRRRDMVILTEAETVELRFHQSDTGVYVSVSDQGGTLGFKSVAASFSRCFLGPEDTQVEMKDGGAGLGLYMIFDAATHMKVECQRGRLTRISCWFADRNDPALFSFNFFET